MSGGDEALSARRQRSSSWARLATGPLAAVGAFLGYGAWAYWVNRDHGVRAAMDASVVQGASSFATTLALSWLTRLNLTVLGLGPLRRLAAAALSSATVGIVVATAHLASGTPALLTTMAPSLVFGSAFALYVAAVAGPPVTSRGDQM